MKKIIKECTLLLCGIAIFALMSCSGGRTELSIFIWSEYLPQEIADEFGKEHNVKVNIATYSSPADLYAKVKASPPGTYDVVCATEFYIERLSNEGYLEKLNHDKLPNLQYIKPEYLNRYYDPGNQYSVPYLDTLVPIVINTSMVKGPVTSLGDLYRSEFKNSLVLLADFQTVIGAVNLLLGFDYNETDPVKLKKTEAKLLELKPNVKMLDSDSPKSVLLTKEVSAGLVWSAEAAIAMDEDPDIKVVWPKEGYNVALDSLTVAKGTKNKELAEEFINYILDPEVSAAISEDYPYVNPNWKALELLGPAFLENPAKNPPPEIIKNGIEMFDQDNKTLAIYDSMWTKFTME